MVDGKLKFQTALQILDVSAKTLCGDDFLPALFALRDVGEISTLYCRVLPMLDGTLAPPSDDPRLWSHGQMGESCYVSCCIALVRSLLDKEAYQQFRERARLSLLLDIWNATREYGQSNTMTKVVGLEIVRKLERSYRKRSLALPSELEDISRQLKARELPSDIATLHEKGPGSFRLNGVTSDVSLSSKGEIQGASAPDSLNLAFAMIKTDFQSKEALRLAIALMNTCISQLQSQAMDMEKFLRVAEKNRRLLF